MDRGEDGWSGPSPRSLGGPDAIAPEPPVAGRRTIAWRQRFLSWFALPLAAIGALLVGGILILVFGANPLTGYQALVTGAFGDSYALTSTAVKAAPLLLV